MNKEHSAQYVADVRSAIVNAVDYNRVYWRNAPESAEFPYVIFDARDYGGYKAIEVDLWYLKGNEIELSDTADTLEAELDGLVIANTYHSSIIATDSNKQWVTDTDENILHVNMSFTATYQS